MRSPVLFGKYLLLERISVGGMAEVFKAKTFGVEGFEKIVAIKRILPSMAEDEDFIRMFIDEAKISGQLTHANICQIYELGKIENSHFIAMEYVQGKDILQLQNRFRRLRKQMPLPMAAFLAAKVCEGLDYAHRKKDEYGQPLNIIHRDVSPQNVLVSYEGEVRIIDFGIAKAVSRSSKTQAGVLKGKFGYMSPEQVRGLPLDRRSDLFAIGTLLWEMCTDERLFTGPSDFAVLEKVRNATVPPPSAHNPMIPPELEAIIMRALRRNAEERYQWATEMQEALQNYLLSQSPPWTTNTLSSTVKQMFVRELTREQSQLEQYRKITKADLANYVMPPVPSGDDRPAVSLLRGPTPVEADIHAAEPVAEEWAEADEILEDDDHEATQVGGIPEGVDVGEVPDIKDGPVRGIDTHEFEDGATMVYGAVEGSELSGEPTFVFNAELGQMIHAAQRPVVAETHGSKGNGHSGNAAVLQSSTVVFSLEDVVEEDPDIDISASGPATSRPQTAAVISQPEQPSTVLKDVVIGVLSATVLILLGIIALALFVPWRGAETSALVIATTGYSTGQVMIDGQNVGNVTREKPLTLRKLDSGKHRVVFVPEKGEPTAREVALPPGEFMVVTFTLEGEEGEPGGKSPPTDSTKPDSRQTDQSALNRQNTRLSAERGHTDAGVSESAGENDASANAAEQRMARTEVRTTARRTESRAESAPTDAGVSSHLDARRLSASKLRRAQTRRLRDKSERDRAKTGDIAKAKERKRRKRRSRDSSFAKPRKDRAKPAAAIKGEGYLVTNTVPWARVYIDGRDTGRTTPIPPASKLKLSAGSHKVTFFVDGKRFNFTVSIRPDQIARLIVELPVE